MLRVIAELNDVPLPIIGFQQVGLRPSTHLSDVPDSGERHWLENRVI